MKRRLRKKPTKKAKTKRKNAKKGGQANRVRNAPPGPPQFTRFRLDNDGPPPITYAHYRALDDQGQVVGDAEATLVTPDTPMAAGDPAREHYPMITDVAYQVVIDVRHGNNVNHTHSFEAYGPDLALLPIENYSFRGRGFTADPQRYRGNASATHGNVAPDTPEGTFQYPP